ncbi:homodimeric glycerol 3-phosphate dehydrogenase (quinone) [Cognatiyoonia sediminum]|uniref:Glycerol-3-phosphate dehydrogenase n=1 Tax=Cognatiyoonia sediminum TaxID=1508389 RepID=A0A1M5MHU8_9RHOB|nr:glycerol-3-phosphate dehydrogenase [Cognatiyoonia sediminum]SHG76826.1 homodimeric glycerol 3-phosphate dehydrogenase (quinone) [Cognatiyoonia sediminum]
MNPDFDLFVIGGGINGVGIARDAQGRGLKVGLAEMDDLASKTSSASTKLFHGGLRYLEFFEFSLVRKALIEREVLLRAMPHISWPMRFVLPYHKDMRFEGETPTSKLLSTVMPWMKGRRPSWLIRLGLAMYDNLGGRKILPRTRTLHLQTNPVGKPLKSKFKLAYEYSDCWVEDSRLVVLNARDAEERGAKIMTRTKVVSAERVDGLWSIVLEKDGKQRTVAARGLVNAGGPWVEDIVKNTVRLNSTEGIRLVRGSHIVTKRLFDHEKAYFFQGEDGRIIFAIPYETDFTLIGTTDAEHMELNEAPTATQEEQDYLLEFANNYFTQTLTRDDIVWTYSGVRPLYDDGAKSATAATRDYVLSLDTNGPVLLSVFGGKITTYRKLAENVLAKLEDHVGGTGDWTAEVPLPGGEFPVSEVNARIRALKEDYPFLSDRWAKRLFRAYGTDARDILADSRSATDLGQDFGADLTEAEVRWLMKKEYALTAVDVVWRRSKLGLRLNDDQIRAIDDFMKSAA